MLAHAVQMVIANLVQLAPEESDPLRIVVGDLGQLGEDSAVLGEEGL